jgi:hypothetical protein
MYTPKQLILTIATYPGLQLREEKGGGKEQDQP